MTDRKAPLSVGGRRKLIAHRRARPIARIAAAMAPGFPIWVVSLCGTTHLLRRYAS
jgi:hypothetical protein